MDHPEDPILPFYRRYIEPLICAHNEAVRAQAAQELGGYLVYEYWRPAQREQFSGGLAALGVYNTDALIDALVALLETRKDLPVAWPEEDPYEEGPPLPDQQGEAAVLVLKIIQGQRRTQRMYMLSQRAVPALLKVLDGGYQWNVVEATIGALGESGDERAIGPLLERLNAGDCRAAKALGQLRAIAALLTALANPRVDVRCAAVEALGQYGNGGTGEIPRGWGWYVDDRVFEPLLACLKDPEPSVRRAAQGALGELRDSRAIEPLIACLSASDAWDRQKVPEALSKFWERRSVKALLTCLHDADPFVCQEAIVALGKREELRAIAPIQDRLQDNSPQVRQVAAQVLKQLQDLREKAIRQLLANLQSTSAIARRNAARALAEHKDDPRVIEAWLASLENKDTVETESLWHGLELDDEASNDDVLGVVAGELRLLGPQLALVEPRAFDRLLALAQNKHSFVHRPHAIRVLGALGDPRAVDPLMACLQDRSILVREASVQALGILGDDRAFTPLTMALHDPAESVRQQAQVALQKLSASQQ